MRKEGRELEDAIDLAYLEFEGLAAAKRRARGAERKRLEPQIDEAWERVQSLVKRRSAARVAQMEADAGLRVR